MAESTSLSERKKAKVRESIIQAAGQLFLARDAQSVSMDEIAEAAEVARRTLFNYFPSKDELLYAVAEPVLSKALELVRERLTEDEITTGTLVRLTWQLWQACGRSLRLIYLMEFEDSPRLHTLHQEFLGQFRALAGRSAASLEHARLTGKLIYRLFVPLLEALEGSADMEQRYTRGFTALLEAL